MILLHSPYSSIGSVALKVTKLYHLARIFIKERFDSLSCIRNIECPIFITHGKEDEVIPINEAERLVQEIEKYNIVHHKEFWRNRGHNDMHMEDEVLGPAAKFMNEIGVSPSRESRTEFLKFFKLKQHIEEQPK
mmetsp:Transcript_19508/g.21816  ORF Transcript_19508/g.21816 Transcript_19508/m.21816 type:complete len:134 (-) Transcript_19508:14-415(-)